MDTMEYALPETEVLVMRKEMSLPMVARDANLAGYSVLVVRHLSSRERKIAATLGNTTGNRSHVLNNILLIIISEIGSTEARGCFSAPLLTDDSAAKGRMVRESTF